MADSKVSGLTAASAVDGTEAFHAVQGGADRKLTVSQVRTWLDGLYQPLDSDLTALAALSTTSFGRALLELADAAAARAALGMGDAGSAFGQRIFGAGVAFVLPSSGSFANNGALTLTTALGLNLTQGYFYFPANAIEAGSAAGWYWTVMSSTTAGTVYNDIYSSGVPVVPASPTAFSTTGPGAYTQTTGSDITAYSFTVPANTLGINGQMRYSTATRMANNANAKTLRVCLGSTMQIQSSLVSTLSASIEGWTRAAGSTGKQYSWSDTFSSTSAYSYVSGSEDMTSSKTMDVRLQIATATDYIMVAGFDCVAWAA